MIAKATLKVHAANEMSLRNHHVEFQILLSALIVGVERQFVLDRQIDKIGHIRVTNVRGRVGERRYPLDQQSLRPRTETLEHSNIAVGSATKDIDTDPRLGGWGSRCGGPGPTKSAAGRSMAGTSSRRSCRKARPTS